jgi:hypothetical protein
MWKMPNHPLAEVFGYPIDNFSSEAVHARTHCLCPFGNRIPVCTKDKAADPLGVCSMFDGDRVSVICPVRFRERGIIANDAATFFFPADAIWTALNEVRLNDAHGKSAGNIDVLLVSYDPASGKVIDFGALEVQAVYISGNIREPFAHYMADPAGNQHMDWRGMRHYPRPDYVSSSRKRLAPQLLFKGGILHAWGKKQAVAVDEYFFKTLPIMSEVPVEQAELAWFVYTFILNIERNVYEQRLQRIVYTGFEAALEQLTMTSAGTAQEFLKIIQNRLAVKLGIKGDIDE